MNDLNEYQRKFRNLILSIELTLYVTDYMKNNHNNENIYNINLEWDKLDLKFPENVDINLITKEDFEEQKNKQKKHYKDHGIEVNVFTDRYKLN